MNNENEYISMFLLFTEQEFAQQLHSMKIEHEGVNSNKSLAVKSSPLRYTLFTFHAGALLHPFRRNRIKKSSARYYDFNDVHFIRLFLAPRRL